MILKNWKEAIPKVDQIHKHETSYHQMSFQEFNLKIHPQSCFKYYQFIFNFHLFYHQFLEKHFRFRQYQWIFVFCFFLFVFEICRFVLFEMMSLFNNNSKLQLIKLFQHLLYQ